MSKALTARQDRLATNRNLRAVPLVTITTYTDRVAKTGGVTHYYSDRTFYYDYGNTGTDREFLDMLGEIGDLETTMSHIAGSFEAAAVLTKALLFTLLNKVIDGTQLYVTLRALNLEGAIVEVGQLMLEVQDSDHVSALVGDEHVVFFRGEVNRVFDIGRVINFDCVSLRPQIESANILDDVAKVDPRDLGKRIPHVYGQAKLVPALAWEVGWATTLATEVDVLGTKTITLTDISGLPGIGVNFACLVSGEEMRADVFLAAPNNRVILNQRGNNGTIAALHPAGDTLVELIASTTFILADHECSAVKALYVSNPYNGEIVRIAGSASNDILPTTIFNLADTTTIAGSTICSVTITRAQLDTLMQALAAQAAVTQLTQPVVDVTHVATQTDVGLQPVSGNDFGGSDEAKVRDGDLGTFQKLDTPTGGGQTSAVDQTFASSPGDFVSQTINVFVDNLMGSGQSVLVQVGGSTIGSIEIGSVGWHSFPTTQSSNTVKFRMALLLSSGDADIVECTRDLTYELSDPSASLSTNVAVAIEAAAVGYGLQMWADVDGVEAPDGTYIAASGVLLEHPADIARHMIEARAGEDVDDANWDEAGTDKMALVDNEIGVTLEEKLGRVAFESRSQIIAAETSTGTQYRLLRANNPSDGNYDFTLPAGAPVIDADYAEGSEDGRDLESIFTRWRFLYEVHRPTLFSNQADPANSFRSVLRADPVQSDIAGITTTELDNFQKQFGRQDHPGVLFLTLVDETTAEKVGGWYVTETARVAATARFRGIPWVDAYAIELGDIIEGKLDWWSVKRKVRVIAVSKRWADETVDLVAVEVL